MSSITRHQQAVDVTDLIACAELEHDAFADGGCGTVRAGLVTLFLTEFCPSLAFCYGVVYDLLLEGSFDFPCDLPVFELSFSSISGVYTP